MTDPVYLIGQSLGILSTLCAIARPFCKRKSQILWMNIAVNLLVACNYILIGQIGSGAYLGLVCVVQSLSSLRHHGRGTQAGSWEIAFFGGLYLAFGLLGLFTAVGFPPALEWRTLLELTPLAGTAIMMVVIYAPKEQTARKLLLLNGLLWTTYALCKGSSTFLTNATSATAAGIALWRYHKTNKE